MCCGHCPPVRAAGRVDGGPGKQRQRAARTAPAGAGRGAPSPGDDHRRHRSRHLGMERADRRNAGQCALGGDRRLSPGRAGAGVPEDVPEAGPPRRHRPVRCGTGGPFRRPQRQLCLPAAHAAQEWPVDMDPRPWPRVRMGRAGTTAVDGRCTRRRDRAAAGATGCGREPAAIAGRGRRIRRGGGDRDRYRRHHHLVQYRRGTPAGIQRRRSGRPAATG